ncbi:exo-alpha-sialidase [Actinomadura sp. 1N219]|uniref:exo-alpha-sialidase n=1 Tax=Actinomadura sp. 1N219 TaxID=3375152 RepID=UPI0037A5A575
MPRPPHRTRRTLAGSALAVALTGPLLMGAAAPGGGGTDRAYACRQDIHPQDANYPSTHVASMVKAPNGDLLYSFYAGTQEGDEDVGTYVSRMPVGSRTWQPPVLAFDEPGKPDGNAVLWAEGRTTYLMISTIMGDEWEEAILRLLRSDDNGRTWSAPETVRSEWGYLFGTRPFTMSNGEVLVPIYDERTWASGWYIPKDDYRTWVQLPADNADWPTSPNGAIQPSTVELEPGHLLTFMRTSDKEIYRTESFDYGRTWSPAVSTGLPNPNARIALLKLHDGRLLLAHNPAASGRGTLRLSLSDDGGKTWSEGSDVESEDGTEFSYPYLIQTPDHMIHLSYTHRRENMRHVVFNEAFVRAGIDIPSRHAAGRTEYRKGSLAEAAACHYVNTGKR